MILPEGVDPVTMTDYILMYCGDNEVRYTDPVKMKRYIHSWFSTNVKQFDRIWFTINAEYNPIENYDRHGEYSETEDTTGNEQTTGNETNTDSGSDTENSTGTTTRTPNLTSETKTSAYDTSSYQPREQVTDSGTEKNDGTTKVKKSHDYERKSDFDRNVDQTQKREKINTDYIHGNIGTMTAQTMIEQEREIAKFNFYKYVASLFEDEFTLAIY